MLKDKTKIFLLFSIVLITLVGISAASAVDADDSSATTIEDASSSAADFQANVNTQYDNNKNIQQKDVKQSTSTEKDVASKADVTSNKTVEKTTQKNVKGVDSQTGIDLDVPATANAGETITVTATTVDDYEQYDITVNLYEPGDTLDDFPIDSKNGIIRSNSFVATFTLPGNKYGTYTVNAEGFSLDYESSFESEAYTFTVPAPSGDDYYATITAPETANVGDTVTITCSYNIPPITESSVEGTVSYTTPSEDVTLLFSDFVTEYSDTLSYQIPIEEEGTYSINFEITPLDFTLDSYQDTAEIRVGSKVDTKFVDVDEVVDATVGQPFTIGGTLVTVDDVAIEDATVHVSIEFDNGTTYSEDVTTSADGSFVTTAIDITDSEAIGSAYFTYDGDINYNGATLDFDGDDFVVISVSVADPNVITVNPLNPDSGMGVYDYGDPVTITGIYTVNGEGQDGVTVKFNVNGEDLEETATTENGGQFTFTYTPDALGFYDYYAFIDENTKSNIDRFTVDPLSSTITCDSLPEEIIYQNDEVILNFTIVDQNNNPVVDMPLIVTFNDVPIDLAITTEDGTFSVPFSQSEAGEYTINVIMEEQDVYAESELNPEITLTVTELTETQLDLEPDDPCEFDDVTGYGTLSYGEDNYIEGATVKITLTYDDGFEDTFDCEPTDEEGFYQFSRVAHKTGLVTITAVYEQSGQFAQADATAQTTVVPNNIDTEISLDEMDDNTTATEFEVVGTIEDENGEPLTSGTININVTFDGETTPVETTAQIQADGTFATTIDATGHTGPVAVKVTYDGAQTDETIYNPSEQTATITLLKTAVITIEGEDTEFSEGLIGSGWLYDETTGDDLADKTVTITATYDDDSVQTFTAVTDSEGIYQFNETPLKTGLVTLVAEFVENGVYEQTTDEGTATISKDSLDTFIDLAVDPTTVGDTIEINGEIETVDDDFNTLPLESGIVNVVAKFEDGSIETVPAEISAGSFSASIPATGKYGLVNITATYERNETDDIIYESSSADANTTLLKSTILDIEVDDEYTVSEGVIVSGYLVDYNYDDLANQNVIVIATYSDGTESEPVTAQTDDEGTFTITIPNPVVGEVTVTATFEDTDEYAGSEDTATTTVKIDVYDTKIYFTLDDEIDSPEELVLSGSIVYVDADDEEQALAGVPLTITVTIDDEIVQTIETSSDSEGNFNAVFDTTDYEGLATIEVTYAGDVNYTEATASDDILITNKALSNMILAVDTPYYLGVESTIGGSLFDDETDEAIAGADVTVTVTYDDDSTETFTAVTESDGSFTVPFTPTKLGDITISAEFEGNDDYKATSAEEPSTVEEQLVDAVIDYYPESDEIFLGDDLVIDAVLHADDDDDTPIANAVVKVKVTIGDEVVLDAENTTDADGRLSYVFVPEVEGTAVVELTFEGNDDYTEAEAEGEVLIKPARSDVTIVIATDDEYPVNEDLEIPVNVFTDDDEAVANQEVTVTVKFSDDSEVTLTNVTDENGDLTVTVPKEKLVEGIATITATIEDSELYNDAEEEATVTITPKQPVETAIDYIADSPVFADEGIVVDAILREADDYDAVIAGVDVAVTLTVNGETIETKTVTTGDDGSIECTFDTTGLVGDALVEIVFGGNDDYANSIETQEIEIKAPRTEVIILMEPDDSYPDNADMELSGLVYTADDDETPVEGAIVNVVITFSDDSTVTLSNVTEADGTFTIVVPQDQLVLGDVAITATIEENDTYNESTTDAATEIVQEPLETAIDYVPETPIFSGETLVVDAILRVVEDDSALCGESVLLKITIGNEVVVDNVELVSDLDEGRLYYEFDTTGHEGTAVVELTYAGEEGNFLPSSATDEVVIKPARTEVVILMEPDDSYPDNADMELSGLVYTADDDETPVEGATVNVVVTFSDDSTVTVSNVTEADGTFTIVIPQDQLVLGDVAITATIEEDDTYNESTTDAATEVVHEPVETMIDYVATTPIFADEGLVVDAVLHVDDDDETPIANKEVTIAVSINDQIFDQQTVTTDENGNIYYEFDVNGQEGNALVEIIFVDETEEYADAYASDNVEIKAPRKQVLIALDADETYEIDSTIELSGELSLDDDDSTPVVGQTVEVVIVYSDGTNTTVTNESDENGAFTVELPASVLGDATITATLAESDLYNESTAEVTTEIVEKEPAETMIDYEPDTPIYADEGLNISALLHALDDEETPIAGAEVSVKITIGDEIFEGTTTTDSDGTITYNYDTTGKVGTATVELTYAGDATYAAATATADVEIIEPKKDVLIAITVDDTYELGSTIVIDGELSLMDDDTPVVGQKVNVTIVYENGDSTTLESEPTDENGAFTVELPASVVGEATITVSMVENDLYNEATEETTTEIVEVIQKESVINYEPDTPIEFNTPIEVSAELGYYDDNDEFVAIAGVPVNVKVTLPDGSEVTQTVYTDDLGTITATVDTDAQTGDATVEITFEGNDDYTEASATGTVEILEEPTKATDIVLHVMLPGSSDEIENDTELEAPPTVVIEGQLLDSEGNPIPVEGLNINYSIVVKYADGTTETLEGQINVDEESGDWMLDDLEVNNAANVTISVFFEGYDLYNASDVEERHFSVGELVEPIVQLEADPNPAELGDEVTVTATVVNPQTGEIVPDAVIIIIITDEDGQEVVNTGSQTVDNGILEITFTPETIGEFNVYTEAEVEVAGEINVYNNETTLTVNKAEVETEIVDLAVADELFEGKESTVNGTLQTVDGEKLANKPILVTVSNEDGYEETFEGLTGEDGKFSVAITPSTIGPVTVTVSYAGEENDTAVVKNASASADSEIVSVEYEVTLDELEDVYDYNTTVPITGQVTSNYEPLDIDEITISINGEEVTVPLDQDGKFSYDFKGDTAGTYEVVAIVNDETKSEAQTFDIDMFIIDLEAEATTDVVFIGDDEAVINGTLTDMDTGAAIADAPITIIINGEVVETTTTDAEGKFTYSTGNLVDGVNNVTVVADATVNYDEDSVDLNVTAKLRHNLTIEIINPTADVKINDTVTIVVITSDNGKIVSVDALNYTFNETTEELPVTGTHGEYTVTSDINGTFTIEVSYAQDDDYNYASNTTTVTFRNLNTAIESNDNSIQNAKVYDEVELSVDVVDENGNPVGKGTVEFFLDNVSIGTADVTEGTATIKTVFDDTGRKDVTVKFTSEDTYEDSSSDYTVVAIIDEATTNLTVDPVGDLEVGKETNVTGKVTDEEGNPIAGVPVTVTVGDKEFTGETGEDGTFSIPVTPSDADVDEITVSVPAQDGYEAAEETIPTDIAKQDPTLTVDPIDDLEAGKETPVTGKVTDEDGNPVAGAPVTVKVGDKEYTGETGEDGTFSIPVTPEEAGNTPVTVSVVETDSTKPVEQTTTADVGKQDAKVTVNPITGAEAGKEVPVTGKVTDEDGNPVAGAPVTVKVGDKEYTGNTNEQGEFSIPVTPETSGKQPVTVSVGETATTEPANKTTTANVAQQDATVTVDPITDAKAGKEVPVTGKVTDEEGNPVANAPVTVKVGNKTYTGTTDEDGRYNIPVTPEKSGNTPVTVSVGKTNATKPANATTTAKVAKQDATVTVDPVTDAQVNKTTPVTGKVTDEEGNPVAGAPVTVKVGDKTYTGTTDKDGKYSIPVTPTTAGNNPVTVSVGATNTTKAASTTDAIVASKLGSTITLDSIKAVKVGDTYNISGTLKDSNGKAIANAKVSINVDGKKLTATTDNNGKFTTSTTAQDVGKEEVTALFAGNANVDASNTANATVTVSKLGTTTTVAKVTGKALNNITVTATVKDANGKAITSGVVYFTDSNKNVLGLANVTNGKASVVTSYPEQYNGTITASYLGSDNYTASTGTVKANITKQNVVIKADPITGQQNDIVTIKATITDENGNPVQSGNVIFKINSQSVKDANGTMVKVQVINGTVTADVNATAVWKGNSTLTIKYLGDNTYNALDKNTTANISPRKAQIQLITDKIARGGDQIVLTAFVTDNGEAVNGGQVIFKVNGETIKDASGKAIIANVVNGTASIVYDIRPGMSAKDLNMSVVLSNKLYDRTENSTILTIVRSDVYFNTSIVYAKDGKAHITATLRDAKGELCVYNTEIALKVGGKTQLATAVNGIIDCEIDVSFLKPGVWELYYVAGLNNRYNAVRMTNALVVE